MKRKSSLTPTQRKAYEKIAEEATIDTYDESEQISGWECVLDEKYVNAYKYWCKNGL